MKYFSITSNLLICNIYLLLLSNISAQGVLDQPDASLGWESWRNLTEAAYEAKIDNLKQKGYRPVDVEVVGGTKRTYATIWRENTDNRKWVVKTKLTAQQFSVEWEKYKNEGYRPIDQETHVLNSTRYYGAIWIENTEKLGWYSYRNLTSDEFHQKFEELRGKYIPVDVDAYQVGNQMRYSAIWIENKENIDWVIKRNLSESELDEEYAQRREEGYRVYDIEVYTRNSGLQYAVIFVKEAQKRGWYWRYGMNSTWFHNYWARYRDMGYRIEDIEVYQTSNGTRYAGVWVENSDRINWAKKAEVNALIQEYQSDNDIPGISVAIVHKGKLVYSRGFGWADVDEQREAHAETVYLLGSTSKVIGGTLAAKFENENELGDGTNITLDLTNLTTNYLPIPNNSHTHTVQQLLSHLGCIWHYNGAEPPAGHYATARLATEQIWNNATLAGCTIGTAQNYSTHAFTFVGAVLEQVTSRPIARLVEEEIADRYNLNSIRVQFRNPALRNNPERATPYNTAASEISYSDNSWKVLGGGIEANAVDMAWFGWKVLNGEIVNATTRDNRLWNRVNPAFVYGLAWQLRSIGGRQVAEHGGLWRGARSHLRVYRDNNDQLIIVVLSNYEVHSPAELVTSIGNAILNP